MICDDDVMDNLASFLSTMSLEESAMDIDDDDDPNNKNKNKNNKNDKNEGHSEGTGNQLPVFFDDVMDNLAGLLSQMSLEDSAMHIDDDDDNDEPHDMNDLAKLFSEMSLGDCVDTGIELNVDLGNDVEISSSSTSDTGSVMSQSQATGSTYSAYSVEQLDEECFFAPASGNDAALLAYTDALENGHYDTVPSPLLSRQQLEYAHDYIFGICCR